MASDLATVPSKQIEWAGIAIRLFKKKMFLTTQFDVFPFLIQHDVFHFQVPETNNRLWIKQVNTINKLMMYDVYAW